MAKDYDFFEMPDPYRRPSVTADDPTDSLGETTEPQGLEPFKTVWTRPRETIRRIVNHEPSLYVIPLACIAGIGQALGNLSNRNAGDQVSVQAIVLFAVLLGPVGGLISLYLGGYVIRLTGSWIGGVATWEQVRAAIAWSSVPAVMALVLWVPQLVFIGSEMFTEQTPRLEAEPGLMGLLAAASLAEAILGVWGFVLLCKMVAEVQGFVSAWKGLGNILLAFLIIFAVVIAILLPLFAATA